MPWVRCAFDIVSRPILRPNFFWDCYWNTLWDKIFSKCYLYLFGKWYQHSYNFKGNRLFSHFLSWIMRNSKTFLRPLQRFFLDQIQTNSETFLRPKFLRPIPRLFFTPNFLDQYWDIPNLPFINAPKLAPLTFT